MRRQDEGNEIVSTIMKKAADNKRNGILTAKEVVDAVERIGKARTTNPLIAGESEEVVESKMKALLQSSRLDPDAQGLVLQILDLLFADGPAPPVIEGRCRDLLPAMTKFRAVLMRERSPVKPDADKLSQLRRLGRQLDEAMEKSGRFWMSTKGERIEPPVNLLEEFGLDAVWENFRTELDNVVDAVERTAHEDVGNALRVAVHGVIRVFPKGAAVHAITKVLAEYFIQSGGQGITQGQLHKKLQDLLRLHPPYAD